MSFSLKNNLPNNEEASGKHSISKYSIKYNVYCIISEYIEGNFISTNSHITLYCFASDSKARSHMIFLLKIDNSKHSSIGILLLCPQRIFEILFIFFRRGHSQTLGRIISLVIWN